MLIQLILFRKMVRSMDINYPFSAALFHSSTLISRFKMPVTVIRVLFCFLCLAATGCIEKYEPLPVATDNHFLVVEGFINTSGTTNIKLSRTIRLSDTARPMPEGGALVTVEAANNVFFLLQ